MPYAVDRLPCHLATEAPITLWMAAMATAVPSGTAELATEMLTQMRAQDLVMQQHLAQVTPADPIVSGIPACVCRTFPGTAPEN